MKGKIVLNPDIWHKAWIHFKDEKLIQCGNGLHPENELCTNCYRRTSRRES